MCFKSKRSSAPAQQVVQQPAEQVARIDPVAEQRKAEEQANQTAFESTLARRARRRRTALATGSNSLVGSTALQTYGQASLGNFNR